VKGGELAKPLPEAKKRQILDLLAKGLSGAEVAKRAKVSQATVSNVRNATVGEVIAPSATPQALAAMAPADRLEAQLATLDQVIGQPGLSPTVRTNILRTYSQLLERSAKMRQRDGKGERQFDGLADLLLAGTHAEAARWSKAPADWLADAVPRQMADLHELAGALERVPADTRKAHDGFRTVLLRILTLLDAP